MLMLMLTVHGMPLFILFVKVKLGIVHSIEIGVFWDVKLYVFRKLNVLLYKINLKDIVDISTPLEWWLLLRFFSLVLGCIFMIEIKISEGFFLVLQELLKFIFVYLHWTILVKF